MNVKELREKYNLSQQQLSDKTGIPKGRINGWEQQNSQPKYKDAKILEQFFASFENKSPQQNTQDDFKTNFIENGDYVAMHKRVWDRLEKSMERLEKSLDSDEEVIRTLTTLLNKSELLRH